MRQKGERASDPTQRNFRLLSLYWVPSPDRTLQPSVFCSLDTAAVPQLNCRNLNLNPMWPGPSGPASVSSSVRVSCLPRLAQPA